MPKKGMGAMKELAGCTLTLTATVVPQFVERVIELPCMACLKRLASGRRFCEQNQVFLLSACWMERRVCIQKGCMRFTLIFTANLSFHFL